MRPLRLLVTLTLLSAAGIPQVACMLRRADMSMAFPSTHHLAVTGTASPDDCPVTRCVPSTVAQVAGLPPSVALANPGGQREPQGYLRRASWGTPPALPPPRPLLSSS